VSDSQGEKKVNAKWKARFDFATDLIRRVVHEVAARPIGFACLSDLPRGTYAEMHFADAWTSTDMAVRLWGPSWAGGLAIVFADERIDAAARSDLAAARKVMSVALHEAAHWLTLPGYLDAGAEAITDATQRLHSQHDADFIRAATHLCIRADAAGIGPVAIGDVIGCPPLSPPDPLAYVFALVPEAAASHGKAMADILRTPPPAAFTRIFEADSKAAGYRGKNRGDEGQDAAGQFDGFALDVLFNMANRHAKANPARAIHEPIRWARFGDRVPPFQRLGC